VAIAADSLLRRDGSGAPGTQRLWWLQLGVLGGGACHSVPRRACGDVLLRHVPRAELRSASVSPRRLQRLRLGRYKHRQDGRPEPRRADVRLLDHKRPARAAARPVLGHGVHRCYASSALVAIMVHAAVAPAAVRRGQPAVNERTRLHYSSHHAIRKSPWP
jgi:hypothetical protein